MDAGSNVREQSVVKVVSVVQAPNAIQPWSRRSQESRTAAGCVIEGNRVLTVAHAVRYAVYVQVEKPNDPARYHANVEYIDNDSELAILRVIDETFFRNTTSVTFGPLPPRQASLTVYGFPVGGGEVAATSAVVSRIEIRTYKHSGRRLLAIQTDAHLHTGNSGGPVFSNGTPVGIAFQSRKQDSVGYVIPTPIIERFRIDTNDGEIAGVPDLGVYWQKTDNPSLREFLGLGESPEGVLVSKVVYDSSAYSVIEEGDVILEIDGIALDIDGSVPLGRDRVDFSHLISTHQIGDEVSLRVRRGGEVLNVSTRLKGQRTLVRPPSYSRTPTYYIFGGLVFAPVTYEYLSHIPWDNAHVRLRAAFYGVDLPSATRKQLVVISHVLADDINVGYQAISQAVVTRVNGVQISEISDVVHAIASCKGRLNVIEIEHNGMPPPGSGFFGTRIVIDSAKAQQAEAEILARYQVPFHSSEDLRVDRRFAKA